MKKISGLLFALLIFVTAENFAQITFIPQETVLTDTLGSEMVFEITVTNISDQDQTLFIVRTVNSMPADWTSSLCFDACFADFVDSIATTEDFNSSPLTPGESREVSVHIFPQNNYGSGHVQIKAGTFRNQQELHYVDLTAIAKGYEAIPVDTALTDTLGSEMVFNVHVSNISQQEQTLFIVRAENDLPQDWASSLCFDACFASFVDSIATTEDFSSSPLQPGETRDISVHVFPLISRGVGNVRIKVGSFFDPENADYINLHATVLPGDAVDDNINPNSFSLQQNYPNPFNPSTKISFSLASRENVQLKVYDVLGREVAALINDEMEAGIHSVNFDAAGLASGIYIYKINAGKFSEIKKMILEK